MIYIWDNGVVYSSHTIYFVQVEPDVDQQAVIAFMQIPMYDAKPKVLATAESLDWRDPSIALSLREWYEDNWLNEVVALNFELERNPSYYLDESDRQVRRVMDLAVKLGLPITWE